MNIFHGIPGFVSRRHLGNGLKENTYIQETFPTTSLFFQYGVNYVSQEDHDNE